MNLINMISCRERAWSLLLLLLTSESCGALETRGSFIVLLLPGMHDCRSSCLVLPSISLQWAACHRENRTSVLTSRTGASEERFYGKRLWCDVFPGYFFVTPKAVPPATWQLSAQQGQAEGKGAPQGAAACSWFFWGIPSWKLLPVLGRKSIQNATTCLLWACVPLPELNKEGQASLNFTTAAAWCIRRPRVNFLKNDGEVNRFRINRYNQEYLNINSSYWAEQRWRVLWGKGNVKWIKILAGPWWIILHWRVTNVHDGDRNIREDPTQTPFQCFLIFSFASRVQCSLHLSGPWHEV